MAAAAAILTAAAVAAAAVWIFRHGRNWTAAASAKTAAFQRFRHQRHADLPTASHTWLHWDRAVAAGVKFTLSPLLYPPLSPRLLLSSRSRTKSIVHPFSYVRLKLAVLVEKPNRVIPRW